MREIILIAHNLRSCHNVGSLLRTAEGLGIATVCLTGYSPYPAMGKDDPRLPHLRQKITKQIHKTALDAENLVNWEQSEDIKSVIGTLRNNGYAVMAIEQSEDSVALPDFTPGEKVALLVGREVEGIEPEVLALCDGILEIPMFGQKESFNVVQAAAMAMYHCRFI